MKVGTAAVLFLMAANANALDMVMGVGAQEGETKAVTQQIGVSINGDGFFQGTISFSRFGESVKKPGNDMPAESVALSAYLQPGISVKPFSFDIDLRANLGLAVYRTTLRSNALYDTEVKDRGISPVLGYGIQIGYVSVDYLRYTRVKLVGVDEDSDKRASVVMLNLVLPINLKKAPNPFGI